MNVRVLYYRTANAQFGVVERVSSSTAVVLADTRFRSCCCSPVGASDGRHMTQLVAARSANREKHWQTPDCERASIGERVEMYM